MARSVLPFAVAFRCGGVIAAAAAAAIGPGAEVSRGWQAGVLGALACWSAFFSVSAVRRGMTFPLVAADAAAVSLALLAQPKLIPAGAVTDETTWGIMLAGTSVCVAQLALRPLGGLPLAALVIAAYAAGAPVLTSEIRVLVAQAAVVCALMELLRHGGRQADRAARERDRDRQRARVAAARRADDRHQRALMHDSVLTVLSMVATAGGGSGGPALRRGAARALDVLAGTEGADEASALAAAAPFAEGGQADLLERLDACAAAVPDVVADRGGPAAPGARGGDPLLVPEPVAAALAGAAGEALRNVARHAGTGRASVRAERRDGVVVVEVSDRGRGFDPAAVPAGRQGIGRSISDRMAMVGGGAAVRSRPGAGTRVVLWWPHV
ncbi:hypothetical protein GEV43_35965 [Actinomadura sp. J1-007]|uniref:sensor histidine kinase n=1 Tax=Actinomadura sp. J1-007 TaxID=2661913 RepID=UPI0013280737|nr:ATP-binding protein [Actinomadura sp. J1-007]MWK38896.1 hypothetical protein [Actinomadura sp. J1-007]